MKETTSKAANTLLDIIPEGEENAVSMKFLSAICETDERTIRKAIFDLRCSGAIIAGTSAGYYIPVTEQELKDYYTMARSRALSTFRSLKAVRADLKQRGLDPD